MKINTQKSKILLIAILLAAFAVALFAPLTMFGTSSVFADQSISASLPANQQDDLQTIVDDGSTDLNETATIFLSKNWKSDIVIEGGSGAAGDLSTVTEIHFVTDNSAYTAADSGYTAYPVGAPSATDTSTKNETVIAYVNGTIINIYCTASTLYFPQNCRYLFSSSTYVNGDSYPYQLKALTTLDFGDVTIDTSSVTEMDSMFDGCSSLSSLDVSKWNTSGMTSMSRIFFDCSVLSTLDVSNWDTGSVTNMGWMFYNCSSLVELDLTNWTIGESVDVPAMFNYCSKLSIIKTPKEFKNAELTIALPEGSWYEIDSNGQRVDNATHATLSSANTGKILKHSIYFSKNWKSNIVIEGGSGTAGDLSTVTEIHFVTNNSTYTADGSGYTAYPVGAPSATNTSTKNETVIAYVKGTIINIYCTASTIGFPQNCQNLFSHNTSSYRLQALTILDFGSIIIETSGVTNMSYMFRDCSALNNIDVSNWDTSIVTNMSYMFQNCSKLTTMDVSTKQTTIGSDTYTAWDTTSVTNMGYMFSGCSSLTTLGEDNVKFWNTTNVTNMNRTFQNCSSLTRIYAASQQVTINNQSYTAWDTGNVTSFSAIFEGCSSLIELNVSNWNTSKANLYGVFSGCSSLVELDLTNWTIGSSTNVTLMLNGCSKLVKLTTPGTVGKNINLSSDLRLTGTWYKVTEGVIDTTACTDITTDMKNVVLVKTYTVTLDNQSATTAGTTSVAVAYGLNMPAIQLPAKTGYTFGGYFAETNGAGKQYYNQDGTSANAWDVAGNGTLYAYWYETPYFVVTIDQNVETATTITIVSNGVTKTLNTSGTIEFDIPYNTTFTPTVKFAAQSGKSYNLVWGTSASKTASTADSAISGAQATMKTTDITATVTLTEIFTVTATTNDASMGTVSPASTTVLYGGTTETLTATANTNYEFVSWSTTSGTLSSTTSTTTTLTNVTTNATVTAIFGLPKPYLSKNWKSDIVISGGSGTAGDLSTVTEIHFVTDNSAYTADGSGYTAYPVGAPSATDTSTKNETVIAYVNGTTINIYCTASTLGFPQSCGYLFSNSSSSYQLKSLTILDFGSVTIDTSSVTDMYSMFNGCSKLSTLDVSNFDTSKIVGTNQSSYADGFRAMFYGCSKLTTLDVSTKQVTVNGKTHTAWDVSNALKMSEMFYNCSSLSTLDVSNWDTSSVTDMGSMFSGCSALSSLDVSKWDTSSVTGSAYSGFYCMFSGCKALSTLDVSNWDTSSVTSMGSMFYNCSSLSTLDVSNWDTSSVTGMSWMFYYCRSLSILDVSNWDTSGVTGMSWMFYYCRSLSILDVSNWDTSSVTNMGSMFADCRSLVELDLTNWTIGESTVVSSMLSGCSKLVKLTTPGTVGKNINLSSDLSLTGTWYKVTEGVIDTTACTDITTDMKNVVLVKTYTVTLDNQSATTAGTTSVAVAYGLNMPAIQLPTKTYYTFGGYFAETNGAGKQYYNQDGTSANAWDVAGNGTLYAKWIATSYTISYNLDGGVVEGINPTGYTVETDDITLINPTKTGYTFAGWTGTGLDSATIAVTIAKGSTGNRSYTANWTVNNYKYIVTIDQNVETATTITIVANGVTKTLNTSGTMEFDIPFGTTFTPTVKFAAQSGKSYNLVWGTSASKTASTADSAISGAQATMKTTDITATVTLTEIFTITATTNDASMGTISPASTTVLYGGTTETLTATANTNYEFVSWSTTSGALSSTTSTTTTLTNVTTNATVTATFGLPKPYLSKNWKSDIVIEGGSGAAGDLSTVTEIHFVTDNSAYTAEGSGYTAYPVGAPNATDISTKNEAVIAYVKGTIINIYTTDTILGFPQSCGYLFGHYTTAYQLKALTTIDFGNVTIDTSSVTDMSSMFYGCTTLSVLDVSKWDTGSVTSMSSMFYGCTTLSVLDVSKWDTSNVTNMGSMFYNCKALSTLDVSGWDASSVTDTSSMFYGCTTLSVLDVSNWDTSSVTNMSWMFRGCSSLSTLDVSNWHTSSVTNMSWMFYNCNTLSTLDVSGFDTSSVTSMSSMLFNCTNLSALDVSNWNTEKVTDMSQIFRNCSTLTTLDVSGFNTSKVTNMNRMFYYCTSISTLDVSNFDTSKIVGTNQSNYADGFYGMFYGCSKLATLDVATKQVTVNGKTYTAWDVSNALNMNSMFLSCSSLVELDLTNWTIGDSTVVSGMLSGCSKLVKLTTPGNVGKNINLSSDLSLSGTWYKVTEGVIDTTACTDITTDMKNVVLVKTYTVTLDNQSATTSGTTSVAVAYGLNMPAIQLPAKTGYTFGGYFAETNGAGKQYYNQDGTSANAWDVADNGTLYAYWYEAPYFVVTIDQNVETETTITIVANGVTKTLNTSGTIEFDIPYNTTFTPTVKFAAQSGKTYNLVWGTSASKTASTADSAISGTQATMKTTDITATVTLTEIFTVTATTNDASMGTVSPASTTVLYGGTTETLTATANTNYEFVSWSTTTGALSSTTSTTTTLTNVTTNATVTATFGLPKPYLSTNWKSDIVIEGGSGTAGDLSTVTEIHFVTDNSTYTAADSGYTAYPVGTTSATDTSTKNESVIAYVLGTVINIYCTDSTLNFPQICQYLFSSSYYNSTGQPSYYPYRLTALTILDFGSITIDTSSVTSMSSMFEGCTKLGILDVSGWNTSSVTSMDWMFSGCSSLSTLDVSKWDTSSVTSMNNMFNGCSTLSALDVRNWNTSSVTNMIYMFSRCSSLSTLDVSKWDTSNVTNMSFMFQSCGSLSALDVSNFDTSKIVGTNQSGYADGFRAMFYGCSKLITLDVSTKQVTVNGKTYTAWDVSNALKMSEMFWDCSSLSTLDVSGWNIGKVSNMTQMFRDCTTLTTLDVSKWDTSSVTSMDSMFNGCSSLSILDVSNWDTNNVTNMDSMFSGCKQLSTLDVSKWDTGSVKNMSYMFTSCSSLSTLDVSKWDTGNVTNMTQLFSGCSALSTLDVSDWDTSSVTDIRYMFQSCSALNSLDVSKWDTSNVTNISNMFRECTSLSTLDVSNWNTSSVTNMSCMFYNCRNLSSLDVSGFNTSKIVGTSNGFDAFRGMFQGCSKLTTLDVSTKQVTANGKTYTAWDVSNALNMRYMFSDCSSLVELDLTNWTIGDSTVVSSMFSNCSKLVKLTTPGTVGKNINLSSDLSLSGTWYKVTEGVIDTTACTDITTDMKNVVLVKTYTVTLDNQSATTAGTTSVAVAYGLNMPAIQLPTKTYYTFGGYFAETNGAGKQYYNQDGTSANAWDVAGNGTLYAKWIATSYTISYDLDGGVVEGTNPASYTIESDDITLINPTKENHFFVGWIGTDLDSATQTVTIAKGSTGNRSYVATWVEGYSISYDLDGGVVEGTNPTGYTVESDDITLINPTKTGYTFAGWTGTGLDSATMAVTIAKGSTGDRSYTANWTVNNYKYIVTIDQNVETATTITIVANGVEKTIDVSGTVEFDIPFGTTFTPTVKFAAQSGKTYNLVWGTSASKTASTADSAISGAQATMNANGLTATVTFTEIFNVIVVSADEAKGTVSPASTTVLYGGTTETLTATANTNYELASWSTTAGTLSSTTSTTTTLTNVTTNATVTATFGLPKIYLSKNWKSAIQINSGTAGDLSKVTEIHFVTDNSAYTVEGSGYTAYPVGAPSATDTSTKNETVIAYVKDTIIYIYCVDSTLSFPQSCQYLFGHNTTAYQLKALTTIDFGNITIDTSSVTDMSSMFYYCTSLSSIDVSKWDTSNVTYMSSMFRNCTSLGALNVSDWNTSNVTSMNGTFQTCSALTSLGEDNVKNWNISNVKDLSWMFFNCGKLINLDVSNWNTISTKDISYMFQSCSKLTEIDVSRWNTSLVTNMSQAFYSCSSLISLGEHNVKYWDTSSVTDMGGMFSSCTKISTLDVSGFNTSKVTNMSSMFYFCTSLSTLDVSNFDTSSVTKMSWMFGYCSALSTLEVGNFNVSKVIGSANTSVADAFRGMFSGCSKLTTLDVATKQVTVDGETYTAWDVSNALNMNSMFSSCSSLVELDLTNWTIGESTVVSSMLSGCSKLVKLTTPGTVGKNINLSSDVKLSGTWYKVTEGVIDTTACTDITTDMKNVVLVKTYTVTLDNQSATTAGTTSVAVAYSINMPAIQLPTKTYYTFGGYFAETNGAGKQYYNQDGTSANAWDIAGNGTLYAKWIATSYTISYDLDGGVVEGTNPASYTIESDDITLINPTKENHFFVGWTGTDLDSATMTVTIAKGSTGNRSYVATWVEGYSISYNLDGGVVEGTNPTGYTVETDDITLINPTKTGYTFAGWTGTGLDSATMAVTIAKGSTGNRSYTANWTVNNYKYIVTIDQNVETETTITIVANGVTKTLNTSGTIEFDIPYNTTFTPTVKFAAQSGKSYNLVWGTSASKTASAADSAISGAQATMKTTDITATVTLTEIFTVTATTNDVSMGTVSPASTTVLYGGTTETLTATANTNYEFVSWSTTAGTLSSTTSTTTTLTNVTTNATVTATFGLPKPYLSKNWKSDIVISGGSGTAGDLSTVTEIHFVTDNSAYIAEGSGYTAYPVGAPSATDTSTKNEAVIAYVKDTIINIYTTDTVLGLPQNCQYLFSSSSSNYQLKALTTLDFGSVTIDTSSVTDMGYMFYYCTSLNTLNVSGWDTSSVTNMGYMFQSCSLLSALDVSDWDTSSVTNMKGMFYFCTSLSTLDVSKWDTSSVTNMSYMFRNSTLLATLDVTTKQVTVNGKTYTAWDTSSVTDMSWMFFYCTTLSSLDVSKWDTSSVTSIESMFGVCKSISNLDVSTWDTSSVTNMRNIFSSCSSLSSIDVSNWDTSKVLGTSNGYNGFRDMFSGCSKLTTLDVATKQVTVNGKTYTAWDVSNALNMNSMFSGCSSLVELDLTNWTIGESTVVSSMLSGCSKLVKLTTPGTVGKNINLSSDLSLTGAWYKVVGNAIDTTACTDITTDMKNVVLVKTHTVTLDNQSATIAGTTSVAVAYGLNMPAIQLPAKTGYTFGGYFAETNGAGKQYYNQDGTSANAWDVAGNGTLYAKWIATSYTISYNLDGGVVEGTNPASYTIESDDITLINPTKTGYTFAGWTGTGLDSATMAVTIAKGSTGDRSYTANWTIVSYTISYDLVGGSVDGTNPTTYTVETDDITLINPTKTGYTFAGWTGTGLDSATQTVIIAKGSIGNRSYTATWNAISYTISYNLDGGVVEGTNPASYTIESDDITLINPTKENHFFVGWIGTDLDSATQTVTIAKGSTGNRSYVATWVEGYSISYDLDGGVVEGTNPTGYTVETDDITLINPTKTGYTFAGWTGTGLDSATMAVTIAKGSTGNRSYTATWTIVSYTILYDLDGGVVEGTNTTTYTIESDDITLINPTKTGYAFAGWTGTGLASATTTVTIAKGSTGDRSYTATWTIVSYTISYDLDGGVVEGTNPTGYTVETDDITLINPTKTGYAFAGWTGTGLDSATMAVTIAKGSTGDRSYTATWTANNYKYTVTVAQNVETATTITIVANGVEKTIAASGTVEFDIPFGTTFTPTVKFAAQSGKSYNLVWGTSASKTASTADSAISGSQITMGTSGATATVTLTEIFTVTATTNDASMGTVSPASTTVLYGGTTETLTATANTNYELASWSTTAGTLSSTTSTTTTLTNLTTNATVTAIFDKQKIFLSENWKSAIKINGGAAGNLSAVTEIHFVTDNSAYTAAGSGYTAYPVGAPSATDTSTKNETVVAYVKGTIINIYTTDTVLGFPQNCQYLFSNSSSNYQLKALTTLDFGNVTIDTSNVTNMGFMFYNCKALSTLDVSGWNIGKVSDMTLMFRDCTTLSTLDVSNWDTGNVKYMNHMFYACSLLSTLDVSNWDTSSVTNMSSMFQSCSSLVELDLSGWVINSGLSATNIFTSSAVSTIKTPSEFKNSNITIALPNTEAINWYEYDSSGNRVNDTVHTTLNSTNVNKILSIKNPNIDVYLNKNWKSEIQINSGTAGNLSAVTAIYFVTSNDGLTGTQYNVGAYNQIDTTKRNNVIAYVSGTVINIYCTASTIGLPQDSSYLFSNSTSSYQLKALTTLNFGDVTIDTSSVTDMDSMFSGCSSLSTLDVSKWNTSSVTSMFSMFSGCSVLGTLDVSEWNTSSVTNMYYMFLNCSALNSIDVSGWDTSSVTNMNSMFHGCSSLSTLDVSKWDTSSVTNMSNMFQSCGSLSSIDVSCFNTSKIVGTNQSSYADGFRAMFYGCSELTTLDVSTKQVTVNGKTYTAWDVSNALKMSYMFYGCSSLSTLNVSGWNTGSVTNMGSMFFGCSSLVELDLSGWVINSGLSATNIFTSSAVSTIKTPSEFKNSNITIALPNTSSTNWYEYDSLGNRVNDTVHTTLNSTNVNKILSIKNPNIDVYLNKNWKSEIQINSGTAGNLSAVTAIHFVTNNDGLTGTQYNVGAYNLGETTKRNNVIAYVSGTVINIYCTASTIGLPQDSSYLFSNSTSSYQLKALTTLNFGSVTIDTSSVTDMSRMFSGCSSLSTLDVSKWDTSSVTNMGSMFEGCSTLSTLDVNTKEVTANGNTYTAWDTSSVTGMGGMLFGCKALITLDVSGWNTSSVTSMYSMFSGCSSLSALDVSKWDTAKATDMRCMFENCANLFELDFTNWTIPSHSVLTTTQDMFKNCTKLSKIITPKLFVGPGCSLIGTWYKVTADNLIDKTVSYSAFSKSIPANTLIVKFYYSVSVVQNVETTTDVTVVANGITQTVSSSGSIDLYIPFGTTFTPTASFAAVSGKIYNFVWGTTPSATQSTAGVEVNGSQVTMGIEVVTATVTLTEILTVTIVSSDESKGSVSPTSTRVLYGVGTVNIVATPKAGFMFAGWSTTNGSLADKNSASTTLSNITSYPTVTANWDKISLNFKVVYSSTADFSAVAFVKVTGQAGTFSFILRKGSTYNVSGLFAGETITVQASASINHTATLSASSLNIDGTSNEIVIYIDRIGISPVYSSSSLQVESVIGEELAENLHTQAALVNQEVETTEQTLLEAQDEVVEEALTFETQSVDGSQSADCEADNAENSCEVRNADSICVDDNIEANQSETSVVDLPKTKSKEYFVATAKQKEQNI